MSSPALPPQSASLSVTVAPNPLTVNTYGPAYATATLSAVPAGGAAPYSYVWVSQGTAHSTLSSSTVATPTISATLNWGDSFTDTWQVTVTDAGNKAVSATV
ncbi:MAG: hypothetical protein JO002_14775, partial [Burkholderiaceae bacterium]|nr:hypothetical protein [Burkholderiaceae bacterium]